MNLRKGCENTLLQTCYKYFRLDKQFYAFPAGSPYWSKQVLSAGEITAE